MPFMAIGVLGITSLLLSCPEIFCRGCASGQRHEMQFRAMHPEPQAHRRALEPRGFQEPVVAGTGGLRQAGADGSRIETRRASEGIDRARTPARAYVGRHPRVVPSLKQRSARRAGIARWQACSLASAAGAKLAVTR